eukprot:TRINITY_DN26305_c0_g1_i1.p1 TRINITY_DN26305_c0_g1~~TRINITY_DN26305_c0_g1_i1.p1  ORF type:complete len:1264 (+),score=242.41 TRINITY_DN26305_c0_g1_i1:417-4208(+)
MRDFEAKLTSMPQWIEFCEGRSAHKQKGYARLCDPGESFAAYAWPQRGNGTSDMHYQELRFNSEGREVMPLPGVLAYIQRAGEMGEEQADLKRYFPKDFDISDVDSGGQPRVPPAVLRTTFSFAIKIGDTSTRLSKIRENLGEATSDYAKMIEGTVYDVLKAASHSYPYTDIYYFGDSMETLDITSTLSDDLKYATVSIVLVTVYMWYHTRSLALSVASLFVIFAAIPLAYVLTPAAKTTIASFLSVFLMTGIGSDVVFVFTDFWSQSTSLPTIEERLVWMIVHAGKSCVATSLTTSVSFFANLASCLQALREFGLFMGLCVTCAFFLILLFLPPFMVIFKTPKKPRTKSTAVASLPVGTPATPPKPSDAKPSNSMGVFFFAGRCPISILFVAGVSVVVFVVGIYREASLSTGVPQIFPADHNQVAGQAVATKFAQVEPLKKLGEASGEVCSPTNLQGTSERGCMLHWCEVEVSAASVPGMGNASELSSCYVGPTRQADPEAGQWKDIGMGVQACGQVNIKGQIVLAKGVHEGLRAVTKQAWFDVVAAAVNVSESAHLNPEKAMYGLTSLPELLQENWASGETTSSNFASLSPDLLILGGAGLENWLLSRCEVPIICYVGTQPCRLRNWKKVDDVDIADALEAASRRLETSVAARTQQEDWPNLWPSVSLPSQQASLRRLASVTKEDISVLFGVLAPKYTPIVGALDEYWRFDPSFEADSPWAQRAALSLCEDAPKDLRITKTTCWMSNFRKFLVEEKGRKFPSRNFEEDVGDWHGQAAKADIDTMWFDGPTVKAYRLVFWINRPSGMSADQGLALMAKWNEFVGANNGKASIVANRAWHTAGSWVTAEAEVAIVSSTKDTIIISAVCAWAGMLLFTGEPWLSFIVLGLVLGIISGLAFFMVSVCGWEIGPIEVVSLIIFVGYSVTYALHIAHNYNEVAANDTDMRLAHFHACERGRSRYADRHKRLLLHVATGDSPKEPKDDRETSKDSRHSREASKDSRHSFPSLASHDSDAASPGTAALADRLDVSPEKARHLAKRLGELSPGELREARARMAVLHVGGATLSSALSTLGSSLPLLLCTLTIFIKLGAVVIAVTVLSIVFALVVLPAALAVCGPGPSPAYLQMYGFCIRTTKAQLDRFFAPEVDAGLASPKSNSEADTLFEEDTVRGELVEDEKHAEPKGEQAQDVAKEPLHSEAKMEELRKAEEEARANLGLPPIRRFEADALGMAGKMPEVIFEADEQAGGDPEEEPGAEAACEKPGV